MLLYGLFDEDPRPWHLCGDRGLGCWWSSQRGSLRYVIGDVFGEVTIRKEVCRSLWCVYHIVRVMI